MKTFQEFQEDLNTLQRDLSALHKKGELRRRTAQSGEALNYAVQRHREISVANKERSAATAAEFKKKNSENLEKIKKQKGNRKRRPV
jgi:DeoR/GlpR family transcriptional regulator of sugar metabolism